MQLYRRVIFEQKSHWREKGVHENSQTKTNKNLKASSGRGISMEMLSEGWQDSSQTNHIYGNWWETIWQVRRWPVCVVMEMLWGSKGPSPAMATIRPALMTLIVLGNRASQGCVARPVTWPTPEDVTARFQDCCRLCQLLFSSCMLHPLAMGALPRSLM